MINTNLNSGLVSLAFDSQDNMYLAWQNIVYKVYNGIVKRIAGTEIGDYGTNGNALNALLSVGKIIVNSNNDVIFPAVS